jgi:hypothetical protein
VTKTESIPATTDTVLKERDYLLAAAEEFGAWVSKVVEEGLTLCWGLETLYDRTRGVSCTVRFAWNASL